MARNLVVLASCAVVLVAVNLAIAEKEQLLAEGRVVLLELAPVDPRSLIQGDYMALRFQIAGAVQPLVATVPATRDGRIVVALDAGAVATFRRLDDGRPLETDEVRLQYRVRDRQVKFATNAFFFEEGTADLYSSARYGEFRVDDEGVLLLTGLRGQTLEPLGP